MANKIGILAVLIILNLLLVKGDLNAKREARYNAVKKKIQNGEIVKGLYSGLKDPLIAKVYARAGFDYIWIDLEHTSFGWADAEAIIQAISETDIVPIIRVPWNEHYFIKRALDIGAKGIIVPLVNSKKEAIAAVRACLYPPEGIRGFGPAKAAFYWGIDPKEYIKRANEEILVIVQVEHKNAIENIDEILSVEGVDLAFIGPMDLSASMGFLGNPTHPRVLSAIDTVVEAGKRHKVPLGILSLTPDDFNRHIDQGFQFFLIGGDYGILIQGANQLYNAFQTNH